VLGGLVWYITISADPGMRIRRALCLGLAGTHGAVMVYFTAPLIGMLAAAEIYVRKQVRTCRLAVATIMLGAAFSAEPAFHHSERYISNENGGFTMKMTELMASVRPAVLIYLSGCSGVGIDFAAGRNAPDRAAHPMVGDLRRQDLDRIIIA
jgi:hypothetical protein